MTENLGNGYLFERAQRELSNEYQNDMVKMVFKNVCILVFWKKVALALEWLRDCKPSQSQLMPETMQSKLYWGRFQFPFLTRIFRFYSFIHVFYFENI